MALVNEWELPGQDGLRGVVMYNPDYAEELLPAERFSDEYTTDDEFLQSRTRYDDPAHRGRNSKALKMRMYSISAGWRRSSSGEEIHDAIHSAEPNARQVAVIRAWEAGIDPHEIFEGFLEQAYSFRELAAALHRAGLQKCASAAFLNVFAVKKRERG